MSSVLADTQRAFVQFKDHAAPLFLILVHDSPTTEAVDIASKLCMSEVEGVESEKERMMTACAVLPAPPR
ncbi:hypothetical protein CLAFUW4_12050 [Fulvia fulva]|uniref:Uncharacterized protein n=1 Tax=Passalora fulva TaxID=5499 RepID=A0A9Q8USG2_PASFU|nr:uncharacterized protein CLAFUR5_11089 [Fulvia fulva]KAK4617837.1 hypothetical protein CLAFUR4_12055 [Fulvia fulva]KAK4618962.1 hypothetical protein CLAFUR0_12066 [Fulvia fulva]UJO20768.1 hypothetical protein CLAFUR5_11089 [Fulvia fulva]WPV17995.1 hypothetical protein CLAFUW4_12050 [Fulvia fulva]WPV33309.1 hypothetical protein CLAFUW7_12057 [Fulvia fulva]